MPFQNFNEQLKEMESERLMFGKARMIAQLQSDLVLAEQSLVYGEEMCKDITSDMQALDAEFEVLKKECSEHKGDPVWADKYKRAKAAYEMGIGHHTEERIGIIREMDLSKGRIVSLKAKLKKEGAAPKQQTMEETTFGARMAMMSKLPGKYSGVGSADNFGFTCAAKHLMHSEGFEKNAKAAEEAGNVNDFTHNLASATFYAKASHMLMDMRVSSS